MIYYFEPEFFNKEYSERLPKKEIFDNWKWKTIYYDFIKDDDTRIPSRIEVKRKNLKPDFDRFWLKYVLYSLIFPEKHVKELIDIMKEKHYETNQLKVMLNQKFPEFTIEDINLLLSVVE
tara:strand:- start:410 stop:769 length:360 start_codon:yes stop_codon:yes gene_type:complete